MHQCPSNSSVFPDLMNFTVTLSVKIVSKSLMSPFVCFISEILAWWCSSRSSCHIDWGSQDHFSLYTHLITFMAITVTTVNHPHLTLITIHFINLLNKEKLLWWHWHFLQLCFFEVEVVGMLSSSSPSETLWSEITLHFLAFDEGFDLGGCECGLAFFTFCFPCSWALADGALLHVALQGSIRKVFEKGRGISISIEIYIPYEILNTHVVVYIDREIWNTRVVSMYSHVFHLF